MYINISDMARIGCNECAGCSECCHDMGQSIILDPYDVMRLTAHLGLSFEELMQGAIEVHVEDGLILPNLRMVGEDNPKCGYLSSEGRCSIHDGRPGLCRLFPLGRNYSDGKLEYFVLEGACPADNKTKVKLKKWLGVEATKEYQRYLIEWHDFVKKVRSDIACHIEDENYMKLRSLAFLNTFYVRPFEMQTFFEDVEERMRTFEF